jgi:hydrogenase-4 component B
MGIDAALTNVGGLIVLAVVAVMIGRSRLALHLVYAGCLALCGHQVVLACSHLLSGPLPLPSLTLPLGLPSTGARFRIDALAAFFLVMLNLGGAIASLYAIGYGSHEEEPQRVVPFYPAFLAGMNLVLLADDAFAFLVGWEFMSLSSWALVVSHHHDPANRRAGFIYIVMASLGTFALLLTFGLLIGANGGFGFSEMRAAAPRDAALAGLIVMLALLGAGSKAGLVPLHVWLPLAHPAAPSHVSALMSGVMTKVAVYGFVRIAFDLVGAPVWWWGIVVMTLGAVTAVLGVLQAAMQRDIKMLLAYSTVENIGIVFIGLGLALAFESNGMAAAAALAATAALLHALNHSLFKTLLFFGAGAVLNATGRRDCEAMGGLIHRMPQTAVLVLGGALAISALPPLNGFVSEWMLFQAILLSPELPQWGLKLTVPAVGAMLALGAALSAATFVRFYGIVFLGRPRSPAAAEAREADILSRAGMALPLLLCIGLGALPGLAIDKLSPVVNSLTGSRMAEQAVLPWATIAPIAESRSSYSGLLVLAFIAVSTLLTAKIIHRFASRQIRRAPPWDCGFPNAAPATQYTADSFAQPLRRVFAGVLAARDKVDMPPPGDPRPARLTVHLRDRIWDLLYGPAGRLVSAVSGRLNRLQFLTIRQYLSLVFGALVGLLTMVAIWA